MNIAGGDTTEDPINHGDFASTYESGEGEYRNKRRTEKHLGAEGKKSIKPACFILQAIVPLPSHLSVTQKPGIVCLCVKRVLRRPYVNAKSPRLLHRRTIAQLLHMGAGVCQGHEERG